LINLSKVEWSHLDEDISISLLIHHIALTHSAIVIILTGESINEELLEAVGSNKIENRDDI
jgi:hypothetical protein